MSAVPSLARSVTEGLSFDINEVSSVHAVFQIPSSAALASVFSPSVFALPSTAVYRTENSLSEVNSIFSTCAHVQPLSPKICFSRAAPERPSLLSTFLSVAAIVSCLSELSGVPVSPGTPAVSPGTPVLVVGSLVAESLVSGFRSLMMPSVHMISALVRHSLEEPIVTASHFAFVPL